MQFRVYGFGLSAGVPKTIVGVDIISFLGLQLRSAKNGAERTYQMTKGTVVGNPSGSMLLNAVSTRWHNLSEAEAAYFCKSESLSSTQFDISISGYAIGESAANVVIRALDVDNRPVVITERVGISVKGVLFSELRFVGNFKLMTKGSVGSSNEALSKVCSF